MFMDTDADLFEKNVQNQASMLLFAMQRKHTNTKDKVLDKVLCMVNTNNDHGNVAVFVAMNPPFMECSERHKYSTCCRDVDDVP